MSYADVRSKLRFPKWLAMENISPIIRFLFLAYNLIGVTCVRNNETDRLSLLAFKSQVLHDPHKVLVSWNDSSHFCHWFGVTCGKKHQRVTSLDLHTLRLSGTVSSHIGNLSFLRILNLQNNSFTGHIPLEVGRLFRLQVLRLHYNSFNGEIPRNISGCSNLLHLHLGSNNLIGRIPNEISSLSKLTFLSLQYNRLEGEISPSFGNLSSLWYIAFGINKLEGKIPDSFGQLKKLNYLYIGENNLSGQIPPSIYNLSSLIDFSAPWNQLQGSLPPDLGHKSLPNIEMLHLGVNRFHGPIPISITNASKLSYFIIPKNQFIGIVPVLGNLPSLEIVMISYNGFTNNDLDFLYPLVNCTHLNVLDITDNSFGGKLPEFITNFSINLEILQFGQNHIRGNVPSEIGNLVNLYTLTMEKNELTGTIPNSIVKLDKVYYLHLWRNKFSGAIPPSIGNLKMLGSLDLSSNNLEGIIPPSLGQCRNLIEMSVSRNNLTGSIPGEIFNMPTSPYYFDFSENNLTGSIPEEVGKQIKLVYLNVSGNRLSGEIPTSLSSCVALKTLSFGSNMIEGIIPESLKSFRGIEILDFSQNNLSGKIPEYFENFQDLQYLNLSFNDFEGELATQGLFKNGSRFSVMGNLKLCGGISELKLPKCKSNEPKKKLSHKMKLFIIIASVIIGLISILSFFVALFWLRKKRKVPTPTSLEPTSGLQVSYYDLFKATNGFSSSNLIGCGGFGSVYKGIMDESGEMVVAVKVFNLQSRETFKSFKAECEALRNIRHRNLVRSLSVCSSIDSQGNEFLALVYEFMEKGSLEDWLYPCEGNNRGYLNLMQRLNIAIEVANALEYMHKRCHNKIVHCDLKPSNILLDADLIAHVGDFGLARFIRQASSDGFSLEQSISSIGFKGSIGYVAPEYGMGSEVSTEGDIYSYGILLLEMFIGKRPTDAIFKDGLDLHNFALMGLSEGISKVVDPIILEMEEETMRNSHIQNTHNFLVSIIQIGMACSVRHPKERKDIDLVATELSSIKRTHFPNRRTSRVRRNVVQRAGIPPS